MKSSRQPADQAMSVKTFLAAQLGAAATVTLRLPNDWQPTHKPAVVVFDDSGPMQWPVSTVSQVRVTVWSDGRTTARTIAGKCLGWLLCIHVAGIAHIAPGTAILDDLDEHNGGRMAGFTVRAKARTLPL